MHFLKFYTCDYIFQQKGTEGNRREGAKRPRLDVSDMQPTFSDSSSQMSMDSDDSDKSDSDLSAEADPPIYSSASFSVSQFNSIFLTLNERHNLSSQATDNILKFLHLILPQDNRCCSSSYRFEKSLSKLHFSYNKYITCLKCQHPLDYGLCTNNACALYNSNGIAEGSSTFFVISVLKELKELISGEVSI